MGQKGKLRRIKRKLKRIKRTKRKCLLFMIVFPLSLFRFLLFVFYFTLLLCFIIPSVYIDSGAEIPRVSREFASTILAQFTRANLAALTFSSSAAITGTKR